MQVKLRRVNQLCVHSLTQEEIEKAIVASFKQIDSKRAEQEKESLKHDSLAESAKELIKGTFLTIIFVLALACISFVISLIPYVRFEVFKEFYAMSIFARVFGAMISLAYTCFLISLVSAVNKETDRNYLAAYFSAITATVALIVALVK